MTPSDAHDWLCIRAHQSESSHQEWHRQSFVIIIFRRHMSITATQLLKVYQESFVNGDAKPLKVITTDDFEFVMTDGTICPKRKRWTGVSNTKFRSDDFNTLYENDEVLVGLHSVSELAHSLSQVMFFAQMKDRKISFWRVHRAFPRV